MFGDLGHGAIMFLFALFLVLREKPLAAKKSDNEVSKSYLLEEYFLVLLYLYLFLGMEYIFFWTLHYITDGPIFYVYWTYI